MVLENRIMSLEQENSELRGELSCLKTRYGLPIDRPVQGDDVSSIVNEDRLTDKSLAMSIVNHTIAVSSGLSQSFFAQHPPPLLSISAHPASIQTTMPSMFPLHAPSRFHYSTDGSSPILKPDILDASRLEITSTFFPSITRNCHDVIKYEQAENNDYDHEPHSKNGGVPNSTVSRHVPEPRPTINDCFAFMTTATAAQRAFTGAGYETHHYDRFSAGAWQRSPLSSHSSDDISDEPLQLTVHKRSSGEEDSRDMDSGKEWSGGSISSHCSYGSVSPPHTLLPLKLRHKIAGESFRQQFSFPTMTDVCTPPYPGPFTNGLAQLSEIALAQASPMSLVKKDLVNGNNADLHHCGTAIAQMELKHFDKKYLERRRRNNEAARKCRENRKKLTRLREVKSDYLETENSKLRIEVDALQEEMKQLRELLDKKRLELGLDNEAIPVDDSICEEHHRRLLQLEQEHTFLRAQQRRLEQQYQDRQRERDEELSHLKHNYDDDK